VVALVLGLGDGVLVDEGLQARLVEGHVGRPLHELREQCHRRLPAARRVVRSSRPVPEP
jgi:hypothetical protein